MIFFFSGLQRLLYSEMGVHLSVSTVKHTRKKLGWKRCSPKYCQMVRETNRIARLAFAGECLETGETFDDVIFTDESTIWLEQHGKICFTKAGRPSKLKPKAKHPFKAHVWTGISKRSATPVLIYTGIMRKEFYVAEIMDKVLLPFTRRAFPDGYRFQQDNDPKHTLSSKFFVFQIVNRKKKISPNNYLQLNFYIFQQASTPYSSSKTTI